MELWPWAERLCAGDRERVRSALTREGFDISTPTRSATTPLLLGCVFSSFHRDSCIIFLVLFNALMCSRRERIELARSGLYLPRRETNPRAGCLVGAVYY